MDGGIALAEPELRELVGHMTSCLTQRDHQSVISAMRWMRGVIGFGQAAITRVSNVETRAIDTIECYFGDEEWKRIYKTNLDPVIAYAADYPGTFLWRQACERSKFAEAHELVESARDHGLIAGMTSSIHADRHQNRNGLLLVSIANVPEWQVAVALVILTAMAPAVIEAVAYPPPCDQPEIKLTPREREVLGWAHKGKGVWEISRILYISESTVKFHFQNIYKKLDVATRPHAIAKAIQYRFL